MQCRIFLVIEKCRDELDNFVEGGEQQEEDRADGGAAHLLAGAGNRLTASFILILKVPKHEIFDGVFIAYIRHN
jgi:hypothetical protein